MRRISAVVPSHWRLEVTSALLKGERKARISQADSARFLILLRTFPIRIDEETATRTAQEAGLILARTHHLSSYDSAYLECALRLGLPLATRDDKLKKAAITAGVPLFEIPEA